MQKKIKVYSTYVQPPRDHHFGVLEHEITNCKAIAMTYKKITSTDYHP